MELDLTGRRRIQVHQLGSKVQLELPESVHDALLPILEERLAKVVNLAEQVLSLLGRIRSPPPRRVLFRVLHPVPTRITRRDHERRARLARDGDALPRLRGPNHSLHLLGRVPTSAAGSVAGSRSGVALRLDIPEEPLERIRQRVTLDTQGLRHRGSSQQLGVPRNLPQHLVRLRHGVGGVVAPASHRRLKRRKQRTSKVLPELLRHPFLDRGHAPVVVAARGFPQRGGVLADTQRVEVSEGPEHVGERQGFYLLRGEKLRELRLRLAHPEHLVEPLASLAQLRVPERLACPVLAPAGTLAPVELREIRRRSLPFRQAPVPEPQRPLDGLEPIAPQRYLAQARLHVPHEGLAHDSHQVLRASPGELAAGGTRGGVVSARHAPRRVQGVAYLIHQLEHILVR